MNFHRTRERLFAVPLLVMCCLALPCCSKPASADRQPPSTEPSASVAAKRPARFHREKKGEPFFVIQPLYGNIRRKAFEYERLPSGAIRFFASDRREYCFSEPLEIKELRSSEDGSEADFSDREKAMNDRLKFYMVTSYLTVKPTRYHIYKYRIDPNGSLHFAHSGSRIALPPPYTIEEDFIADGNHPNIPDYPPSAERP